MTDDLRQKPRLPDAAKAAYDWLVIECAPQTGSGSDGHNMTGEERERGRIILDDLEAALDAEARGTEPGLDVERLARALGIIAVRHGRPATLVTLLADAVEIEQALERVSEAPLLGSGRG